MSDPDRANVWADKGWWAMPNGARRLLSWNAATHELKLWALDRNGKEIVLAVIETEDELDRCLDGWADHNDTKEGLAWLAQRLDGLR